MVKIFIGNLSQDTTAEDLRALFSQYGNISECDVLKRYGFVHMDNKTDAEAAIRNLHQHDLNGMAMNVELSRGKSKASTKLHVSNLNGDCTNQELRSKFEEYGPVVECDIVKDYAFVHLERVEDAMEAISGLDNTAFQGKLMSVQLSTSRLRTTPGMGDQTGCYVCGKQGHWSKDCHLSQNGGYGVGPGGSGGGYGFHGGRGFPRGAPGFARGGPGFPGGPVIPRGPVPDYIGGPSYGAGAGYMGGLGLPPMSRRPSYGVAREYSAEMREQYSCRGGNSFPEKSPTYKRERYSGVDFYEQFRAQPYDTSYSDEHHLPLPPAPLPSSSTVSRELLPPSAIDPYERHPLPPPVSSSSVISRDRSPIRRVPLSGDSYECSHLSPVSSLSRSAVYNVPQTRDTYADQTRYAY